MELLPAGSLPTQQKSFMSPRKNVLILSLWKYVVSDTVACYVVLVYCYKIIF
jgi:hypothetical protein